MAVNKAGRDCMTRKIDNPGPFRLADRFSDLCNCISKNQNLPRSEWFF
ncbi:MAG: hypothetical protein Q8S57_11280 [Methanoregula sp.]|nr:hypothetical protein [Methanoregula sp.]